MRPLYVCRACGFLSTLGSEFQRMNGVVFDKGCLERAEWDGEVARWIADAIASSDRDEDPRHFPTPVLDSLRSNPA